MKHIVTTFGTNSGESAHTPQAVKATNAPSLIGTQRLGHLAGSGQCSLGKNNTDHTKSQ